MKATRCVYRCDDGMLARVNSDSYIFILSLTHSSCVSRLFAYLLPGVLPGCRYEEYLLERGLPIPPYNSTPECNCLPGSGVASGTDPGAPSNVAALCNVSAQPAYILSPIRDWWGGYPGTPAPLDPGSPQRPDLRRAIMRARSRR